jgi:hypothetical protein
VIVARYLQTIQSANKSNPLDVPLVDKTTRAPLVVTASAVPNAPLKDAVCCSKKPGNFPHDPVRDFSMTASRFRQLALQWAADAFARQGQ